MTTRATGSTATPQAKNRRSASAGFPKSPGDDCSVSTLLSNSGVSVGIRRLAPHVLKEVLKDIEHPSFGGIDTLRSKEKGSGQHLLADLLDGKESERELAGLDPLYCRQGAPVRTKIGEYSQRWKKLSELKYLNLLGKVKVTRCRFHPEYSDYFPEEVIAPEPGTGKIKDPPVTIVCPRIVCPRIFHPTVTILCPRIFH
jgi:hypothetical protein